MIISIFDEGLRLAPQKLQEVVKFILNKDIYEHLHERLVTRLLLKCIPLSPWNVSPLKYSDEILFSTQDEQLAIRLYNG